MIIMNDNQKLAKFIVEKIGGKENVESATHCMTRLRLKLKDNSKADRKALDNNSQIISTQEAEGKLQIIIGTNVGDVYEEFIKEIHEVFEEDKGSISEDNLLNRFAALITKIVVPSLGVLCACGIIAGINSILLSTGIITQGDGANILLANLGNTCLTFFPVILGYTSAKAFGLDPFAGMIIGAFLIFPNMTQTINSGEPMFTLFPETVIAMPVFKTFLGIPIIFPATGYTSTVIPIMLVNFLASKIEKKLKVLLPPVTRQFLVPFFTILIAGILGVLVVGPISMVLQNLLQAGFNSLIVTSKILAFAVITLVYQPLVIFGLHWPLITLGIMEYGNIGSTLIVASIFPASFAHMAACLAVFLRSKDVKIKNIALPAFLSACFCIIEPSIYGVTLPVKKRFGFCMAGGLAGGLILALSNSPMYAISMGVTGFMSFVNPTEAGMSGLMWAIVACLVAFAVTFSLTYFSVEKVKEG